MDAIASFFKFRERGTDLGTEARAGLTTFMVMAYIIFLNGNIIAKPLGLDPVAVSAGTALIAGIVTLAMGIWLPPILSPERNEWGRTMPPPSAAVNRN